MEEGTAAKKIVDEEIAEENRNRSHLCQFYKNFQNRLKQTINNNQKICNVLSCIIIHLVCIGFFAWATYYFATHRYPYFGWADQYGLYLLLFILGYIIFFCKYIYKPYLSKPINERLKPFKKNLNDKICAKWQVKLVSYLIVVAVILAILLKDVWGDQDRTMSFVGFIIIYIIGFITSKHPGHIKLQPVFMGLVFQVTLSLLTIKWKAGRNFFTILSERITIFLQYPYIGSTFVYGVNLAGPYTFTFGYKALTTIYFLSSFSRILYHWNVLQRVVRFFGGIFMFIIGTTITESVNCAANIFFGMTEAPLLLKPYLMDLTASEMHAIMAGGFASVAGTVLGAYIAFGANAAHLITCCVITAPATLCFAKLFWPETEESKSTTETIKIPEINTKSVVHAAVEGAQDGIVMVLGIICNIVGFIGLLQLFNVVVHWLGVRVGYDTWSLSQFGTWFFMPISFLLGVNWKDCDKVGELIAIKTLVNEMVAYKRLGEMKTQGIISKRAEVVATYALCGFSNPGSIGIMLGGLLHLVPEQRENIVNGIMRSWVAGIMTCFLTACLAGMMLKEEDI